MRATTLFVSSALVLAALTVAAAAPPAKQAGAPGASAKTEYVCPPCGHEHDDKVYDKAGKCPICGMPLIDKRALANHPRRTVEILLFPGVEIIDFSGPFEVFGQAHTGNLPAFDVVTVAATREPFATSMGLSVVPRYTFDDAPPADVLVLPGGNVDPSIADPKVMSWIEHTAKDATIVLSVCNGAFFLAKAGLLDGLEATTFAGLIDDLKTAAPKAHVVSDRRFVDNGKIITSAGLSSGIDGSLHVVERLIGRGWAEAAATNLEYNWDRDGHYVRAALADRNLIPAYEAVYSYDRDLMVHRGDRDHWEDRWQIRTEETAGEVESRVDGVLSGDLHWQKKGAGAWSFTGKDGAAWNAEAKVEPVAGKPGSLELSLSVHRAG